MFAPDEKIIPAILKKLGLKEIELTNKDLNEASGYRTQETPEGCKITLH
jgi:hypothetical protein